MTTPRKLRAGENLFTWILLCCTLIILFLAYRISGFSSVSSPGSFPMASSAVMVVSLILLLLDNRKAKKPDCKNLAEELVRSMRNIFQPTILIYAGIILVYMLVIERLHFLTSSFLFLLASILFLKGSTPVKSVFISAGTLGLIYLVFHYLFLVVLP